MIETKKGKARVEGTEEEILEDLVAIYAAVSKIFKDMTQYVWLSASEFCEDECHKIVKEVEVIEVSDE